MKTDSEVIEDLIAIADNAHRSKDMYNAFIAIKKLAELRYTPSYEVLGSFYEFGQQPEGRQLSLAYDWYSKGAFEGKQAAGYFALGRFFFSGIYVEKDIPRALELLEVAFAKGSVEAGVVLGYCYTHGIQVPRNLERAVLYLTPASIYGYVAANALLAKIALLQKQFLKGAKFYIKSALDGIRLSRGSPDSPKLYWLKQPTYDRKA